MTVGELKKYLETCDDSLTVHVGNIDCYQIILRDFDIYRMNDDEKNFICFSIDNIEHFLN
jgi:hypothetical protein